MSEYRQTALFSATMPKQLVEFSRAGLNDPQVIRLNVDNKISPNLKVNKMNNNIQ
jgi:ATP-dependent RNA helicase DDX54/DBP10